ncbi:MAG: Fe-S cluster assembly protein SufD [Legionellales bacterium]|nr:Fe-S cluster assembly protein SufD [Legionellales bacterium]
MEDVIKNYSADFMQLKNTKENDWFSKQRQSAFDIFQESGFPNTRVEDWKYTDVKPIAKNTFSNITESNVASDNNEIDEILIKDLDCVNLVFINGTYSEKYSDIKNISSKIVIKSMADALINDESLLKKHLTKHINQELNSFTALNTAFIQDGAYINISANTNIDKPINITYISRDSNHPFATHPRNLIVMGENSNATIIENYVGSGKVNYFTNSVTETVLLQGAVLKHYKIQQEGSSAFHIASLNTSQSKDSRFESHLVSIGGALVRNNINASLNEEGAEIIMNGLYMTEDVQHVDNHTRVDHLKPHTQSHQNYRGVLNGKSRGVFNGKVVVHPQAQKIEAYQNNANLLLSDDAEIDTKPELEIYADDVKCTHGATVGQLDDDMLFYLRSRAVDEKTARSLLTYAFADEVISEINIKEIQNKLERLIIGRLPDSSLIREYV